MSIENKDHDDKLRIPQNIIRKLIDNNELAAEKRMGF